MIAVADRGARHRSIMVGAASGHGLIGMRERVALYGGILEASQRDTGCWLHARLRFEPVPA
jgi:signal transduction histidine kinase